MVNRIQWRPMKAKSVKTYQINLVFIIQYSTVNIKIKNIDCILLLFNFNENVKSTNSKQQH